MKPLSVSKILSVTGGVYYGDSRFLEKNISSVVIDSRKAAAGSLFVCIKGERVDGHDYAAAAAAQGAVCCLSERAMDCGCACIVVASAAKALQSIAAYYRSLFSIPVVGITGSVGKTTAKEMTAAVLSRKYNVLKTSANLNNELGVPLTLLSLDEGHEAAVVEMGISDFGEMSRLAAMVRPDICVMTSVGYCHLENLHDLSGVLRAKSEVFGFMKSSGTAVLFSDDEPLASYDPGIRRISYGFKESHDYHVENLENCGFDGIKCELVFSGRRIPVLIPAFGAHIAAAALAAAAVGVSLGVGDEDIVLGLGDYRPVGSRANVINTGKITVIDDCYNANPNSVSASLKSLSSVSGRRVAILGDMLELGGDSPFLHATVGSLAASLGIDVLLCCGAMSAEAQKGYLAGGGKAGRWFETKEALTDALPDMICPGDTVLVKASHSMGFDEIVNVLCRSDKLC